ncbi:MAG: DUF4175 domain-containing protein [Paracoccaceae bacterium]
MAPTDDPTLALKRVERPVRLTLIGLWAERLARAFWPMWSVVFAVLAVLALGIQDHLSLEVFWTGSVAAILGLAWSAVYAFRRFRRPSRAEAVARLDARLPGRPIAALTDTQVLGQDDPASAALWAAHRARMADRAASARPVRPDPRLAERDPFALRYVALTALAMALIFGSLWRVTTTAGLMPGAGTAVVEAGPAWEGWAQPPPYTGKPALYLNDIPEGRLDLPVGTRIQTRFYGEPGSLTLAETVSRRTEVPAASDAAQEFTVEQSGRIAIGGRQGREWNIAATPDAPPTVTPEGPIGREADGRLKQQFTAGDDYGVTGGKVTIALDLPAIDRRFGLAAEPETVQPVVLDLPMPLTGSRTAFTETLIDDLSKSVMSNLPVTMTFSVTDAALHEGAAAPVKVVLPGKRFFDPLAAAIAEMRRDILWTRANAPRATEILKAITNRPEDLIRNERAYLRLRVAIRQLDAEQASLTPERRDELAEEFWQIALLIEQGDLQSAFDRMQRAQDRLDEAIKNGASQEEIDQLMDEMRQALNEYMRQLAQEAQKNPQSQTAENMPGMQMSGNQLQQMLDELQKAIEEGRTADAAQMMETLRQLMQNMQVVQGPGGGQGGPGQQAMRQLGEALRDQQGLSDDAYRGMQQDQQGEGQQQGQGEGRPGEDFADRQRELRERLQGLNNGNMLPGPGTDEGAEGRRQLDDAGRAMEEAEQALRDGDLPRALDRQAEAMEALRDGMRNLGEALAQENRQENGNGNNPDSRLGQADPQGQRDPLGREPGNSARIGSDKNMLQGQDVYRRAQDLLDEIRRRSGEQQRPDAERDYLKRLLDLF